MQTALIFEKFIRAVKAQHLLNRGDRVVVAVSGGADSVALLHLFLEVRARFQLDLTVAHLNHNLRGQSSAEDQEFVRTLCQELGVNIICRTLSSEEVASRKGNLENWARERRYAFFSQVADDAGAQEVALGHTMNDQAETLLMRLIRGSGTAGLSGMPWRRGVFIRPLLSIERHEILEYLKLRGIPWREDGTNLDHRFVRNRLRQEVIPSLKDRYNPNIVRRLAETAAILREESEALGRWADVVFREQVVTDKSRIIWDATTLGSLPFGLVKRLVRLSFEKLVAGKQSLSAQNVESITELLAKGRSGKFVEIGSIRCFRNFNSLVFEEATPAAGDFCQALRIPGSVELAQTGTCFEAFIEPRPRDSLVLNRWELWLSTSELEAGFFVRNWKPADVYFGPGADSPCKVTEMFAQRKIPNRCRASWPVVVLAGRIVCVKDFPFCADNTIQAGKQIRVVVEERSQPQ